MATIAQQPAPEPEEKKDYTFVRDFFGRAGINVTLRAMESDNFVTGGSGAGWQLTAEGNLEATSGDFRGTLTATAGTIGGFTIDSTTLSANSNLIRLNTGDNSVIGAIIEGTDVRTGSSGSRINLNASTLDFFDSSGNNDMGFSGDAGGYIDINIRADVQAIDIDGVTARAQNHVRLTDDVMTALVGAPLLVVERTSGSASDETMMIFEQAAGTGWLAEFKQYATAGIDAVVITQLDLDKTGLNINQDDAITAGAGRGLLQITPSTSLETAIDINNPNGVASFNLASATDPASPRDGDVWFDGTNIFIRVSGATKTFTIT